MKASDRPVFVIAYQFRLITRMTTSYYVLLELLLRFHIVSDKDPTSHMVIECYDTSTAALAMSVPCWNMTQQENNMITLQLFLSSFE